MNKIGDCKVQYVINLVSSKKLVLVSDRYIGDDPNIEFYDNEEEKHIIARITNTIHIKDMATNPDKGSKDRTDIHFTMSQLKEMINIFTPFVANLDVTFDDAPRRTSDPTGMEHPHGLKLGVTENITNAPAKILANYAVQGFSARATLLYIDAEHYSKPRGKRYHFGARNKAIDTIDVSNMNSFEIVIDYTQMKRFLNSMNVCVKWLQA